MDIVNNALRGALIILLVLTATGIACQYALNIGTFLVMFVASVLLVFVGFRVYRPGMYLFGACVGALIGFVVFKFHDMPPSYLWGVVLAPAFFLCFMVGRFKNLPAYLLTMIGAPYLVWRFTGLEHFFALVIIGMVVSALAERILQYWLTILLTTLLGSWIFLYCLDNVGGVTATGAVRYSFEDYFLYWFGLAAERWKTGEFSSVTDQLVGSVNLMIMLMVVGGACQFFYGKWWLRKKREEWERKMAELEAMEGVENTEMDDWDEETPKVQKASLTSR